MSINPDEHSSREIDLTQLGHEKAGSLRTACFTLQHLRKLKTAQARGALITIIAVTIVPSYF